MKHLETWTCKNCGNKNETPSIHHVCRFCGAIKHTGIVPGIYEPEVKTTPLYIVAMVEHLSFQHAQVMDGEDAWKDLFDSLPQQDKDYITRYLKWIEDPTMMVDLKEAERTLPKTCQIMVQYKAYMKAQLRIVEEAKNKFALALKETKEQMVDKTDNIDDN